MLTICLQDIKFLIIPVSQIAPALVFLGLQSYKTVDSMTYVNNLSCASESWKCKVKCLSWFSWGLCPWSVDSHLLTMSSQGLCFCLWLPGRSLSIQIWFSCNKTLRLVLCVWSQPTHSFGLVKPLKTLFPNSDIRKWLTGWNAQS